MAGHAGIPGNEHADKLANVGARYSKNNTNFEELSLDDILEHYSFDYLKLDGITYVRWKLKLLIVMGIL